MRLQPRGRQDGQKLPSSQSSEEQVAHSRARGSAGLQSGWGGPVRAPGATPVCWSRYYRCTGVQPRHQRQGGFYEETGQACCHVPGAREALGEAGEGGPCLVLQLYALWSPARPGLWSRTG